MDRRMRQVITDSHERTIRLRQIVDMNHNEYVTVGRKELSLLLSEHSLISGFALGASPLEADPAELQP